MFKYSINPIIKFICLLLFLIIIFLSRTIVLNIILFLITSIIVLIVGKKLKEYMNFTIRIILWLIFIILAFIIVLKSISIYFVYKFVLALIIVETYIMTIGFEELDYLVNMLVKPFKLFRFNTEEMAYSITFKLVYIYYFVNGKKTISGVKGIMHYPKYLLSRIMIANDRSEKLKLSLKLKHYSVRKIKCSPFDYAILLIFGLLFLGVLLKEVIV